MYSCVHLRMLGSTYICIPTHKYSYTSLFLYSFIFFFVSHVFFPPEYTPIALWTILSCLLFPPGRSESVAMKFIASVSSFHVFLSFPQLLLFFPLFFSLSSLLSSSLSSLLPAFFLSSGLSGKARFGVSSDVLVALQPCLLPSDERDSERHPSPAFRVS